MKPIIIIAYAAIPTNLSFELEQLSDSQKRRFTSKIRSASDKRKEQFYASRMLLNQLCEHYFSDRTLNAMEPLCWPYCLSTPEGETHSISISHSGKWVAVAIADTKINNSIGVDIQTLKSAWSPQKAAYFCTEEEVRSGFESDQSDEFFTRIWSLKEAYFKASQQTFVHKNVTDDTNFHSEHIKVNGDAFFVATYCDSDHQAQFLEWDLTPTTQST